MRADRRNIDFGDDEGFEGDEVAWSEPSLEESGMGHDGMDGRLLGRCERWRERWSVHVIDMAN